MVKACHPKTDRGLGGFPVSELNRVEGEGSVSHAVCGSVYLRAMWESNLWSFQDIPSSEEYSSDIAQSLDDKDVLLKCL